MFMPKDTSESDSLDAGVESDAEFEDRFQRDFPNFSAHRDDVRALAAVRRGLGLARYKNLDVFVLMPAGSRDVSADRVFAKDDENNVIFYSTRGSIARALEKRGHEAKKADLEHHAEGERAEIFIALDPDLSVTKQLRGHILPKGLVLCRLKAANRLRAYGYGFAAMVKMGSGTPDFTRHSEAFWKSAQVDSDKAFREASSEKNEGVVTYEEARQKVKEAKDKGVPGMSEDDVYKSYSKLIEMAEEQHAAAVSRGKIMLSISTTADEKEVTIDGINTVLPTKKSEHDKDIIVMRRGLT